MDKMGVKDKKLKKNIFHDKFTLGVLLEPIYI